MICMQDDVLLCSRCLLETDFPADHQVEELRPHLQFIKDSLKTSILRPAISRNEYKDMISRLCTEVTTLINKEVNRQITEFERLLQQVLSFEASNIHTLCTTDVLLIVYMLLIFILI